MGKWADHKMSRGVTMNDMPLAVHLQLMTLHVYWDDNEAGCNCQSILRDNRYLCRNIPLHMYAVHHCVFHKQSTGGNALQCMHSQEQQCMAWQARSLKL